MRLDGDAEKGEGSSTPRRTGNPPPDATGPGGTAFLPRAVETMQLGVCITDPRGTILYVNPAHAAMHGYEPRQLVGAQSSILAGPDGCRPPTADELGGGHQWTRERVARRRDGSDFPVRLLSDRVVDARGQTVALVTTCEDVSERRRAEERLRQSEERYSLAIRGANDGIWDWDLTTGIVHFSARWKAILGHGEDDLEDQVEEWLGRIHPEDKDRVQGKLDAHLAGRLPHFEDEHRMRHRDGSYRWVLTRGHAVLDAQGRPRRMAGAQTDITDRRTYDPLTGLANRALFVERLEQAIARARRHLGSGYAVLFIDLDRFKVINDSLGHLAGDDLLTIVARRLQASVRPFDLVGRFGGDEFAVLADSVGGAADAVHLAERILAALRASATVEGDEVFVGASVGIAVSATGYGRAEDVLRDADTAMYRAKAMGRGRCEVFDLGMREHVRARLQLEGDLRRALDREELLLYYQPIVSWSARRVVGFEALLRWQHPGRGLVGPEEFVDLAEETGLIVPIGEWVLAEAARRCQQWQEHWDGCPACGINVNVSARQVASERLFAAVDAALRDTGATPRHLRLEVTETGIMHNPEAAAATLDRLRQLGVHIAVDDFGVGWSSLSRLRHLPVDILKVDRSFVAEAASGAGDGIVRAIVALAGSLRLGVIAEGVETAESAEHLSALGCDLMQGFYFSPAVEVEEAGRILQHGLPHAGIPPCVHASGAARD